MPVLPSLVFVMWAPQVFAWVFGAEWHRAGEFARSLTLWLFFMFCNLPSVLLARIIRIERRMFAFDLSLLAARTLALVAGGICLPATQTVLLFPLIGAVMNVVFIVLIGLALHQKEGDLDWSQMPNAFGPG